MVDNNSCDLILFFVGIELIGEEILWMELDNIRNSVNENYGLR